MARIGLLAGVAVLALSGCSFVQGDAAPAPGGDPSATVGQTLAASELDQRVHEAAKAKKTAHFRAEGGGTVEGSVTYGDPPGILGDLGDAGGGKVLLVDGEYYGATAGQDKPWAHEDRQGEGARAIAAISASMRMMARPTELCGATDVDVKVVDVDEDFTTYECALTEEQAGAAAKAAYEVDAVQGLASPITTTVVVGDDGLMRSATLKANDTLTITYDKWGEEPEVTKPADDEVERG